MVQLDPHIAPQGVLYHKFCGYFAILVVMPFIYLAFMTVFDIFTDGILQTFPIHCSTECLLETGRARVLEIVMVPTYGYMMESCRKDHDCAFTQHLCIVHQSNGVFLITSQYLMLGSQS